jgi:hypothetical protein
VILGVSFDDYFKENASTAAKQGRAAEGLKGQKVQANAAVKEHVATLKTNAYAVHARSKHAVDGKDGAALTIGFQAMGDEEDDSGRGGRGGRGRGGRVVGGDRVAKEGGRRQTARKALAKTDEDFPTL